MLRWVVASSVSAAVAVFGAWLILTNAYPDEGPWLPISAAHGIHIGDVAIVLVWAAMSALLLRWARAARGARVR